MNDQDSGRSSQNSGSGQSTFGVPAAIVVAGALIAAALYFTGDRAPAGNTVAAQPAGAPPAAADPGQVAGITVGDFREVTEADHIRGAKNAKVTIIEYSDLECPFCARFHPTVQQLVDEFPNDVRWVYRHFPLAQLHSKAENEAQATECAGEQGKFWEYVDLIFEVTPSNDGLLATQLPTLAEQVGVANIAQFNDCLSSGKYADKVAADLQDAAAAGGRGTPYSILIGPDGTTTPLSGAQPYASVKAAVEALL